MSRGAGVELNALGAGMTPLPVDPSTITFHAQDDLGVTAQKIAAVTFAGAGRAVPHLGSNSPKGDRTGPGAHCPANRYRSHFRSY